MKDRFKFRCWDKEFNKFYYWGFGINKAQFVSPTSFNPEETQQCTGLKDKNGKLIYEGDIVEYDRSDLYYGAEIIKGRIAVYKFEWAIMYYTPTIVNAYTKKPSLQHLWLGCDDFLGSRTTVIGNIYENYELLEAN